MNWQKTYIRKSKGIIYELDETIVTEDDFSPKIKYLIASFFSKNFCPSEESDAYNSGSFPKFVNSGGDIYVYSKKI